MSFGAFADAIALWHETEFASAVAAAQEIDAPSYDLSRPCGATPSRLSRLGQLDGTGYGWPDDD